MHFEKSKLFNQIKHYKLRMHFGTYYFCEQFIIGELDEGIHFDSKKSKLITNEILDFYGENPKLCLISNRVNSYSVDPQLWTNVDKEHPNLLIAGCIISYSNTSYLNASLEKRFTDKSIKRCKDLSEAINWVSSLDEYN